MDSWLKKSKDNYNKPSADDVEVALEAHTTPTCTSKKFKCNEKNEASHTKKRTYSESFCSMVSLSYPKTINTSALFDLQ